MALYVHLAHHHHASVVIRAQDKCKWLGIEKVSGACPKGFIVWKPVHGSPGRLDLHIENAELAKNANQTLEVVRAHYLCVTWGSEDGRP